METEHRSDSKSRKWRRTIAPIARAGNEDLPSLRKKEQGMETDHRSDATDRGLTLTLRTNCHKTEKNLLVLNNKYLKAN